MEQNGSLDTTELQNYHHSNTSPFEKAIIMAIPAFILAAIVPFIGIFILGFYFYWAHKQYQLTKDLRLKNMQILQNFSASNQYNYKPESSDVDRPGTIFTHGHSKRIYDEISGSYSGMPFNLFKYLYIVGGGKNRTIYECSVMELQLKRTVPHMVIDSLVEKSKFGKSTLPIHFDKSQKLTLEGDFSKYFSLYAPDTHGVSALTLLAPDVMERLMQHASLCDIEFIEDKMYFYWPEFPQNSHDYEEMFATVGEIIQEIGYKLQNSNLIDTTSVKTITTGVAPGIRLRRSRFIPYFFGAFIVWFGVYIYLLSTESGQGFNRYLILASPILTVLFVFHYAIENIKRKRLRKSLQKRLQDIPVTK